MASKQALDVLNEYAQLQGRLCRSLVSQASAPDIEVEDLPRQGVVVQDEVAWRFQKHGAGVRFIGENGVIVDAHVEPFNFPTAVDAWRLVQYCETTGITALSLDGEEVNADDEDELDQMLCKLAADGTVSAPQHRAGLYVLAS
jgi:hypothetical protein